MEIERLTLTPPSIEGEREGENGDGSESDQAEITLSEATVRAIDRSSQLLVLELPAEQVSNRARGRTSIVPGASIAVRTAAGRVHRGYVEVVADADSGRICWCGIGFARRTDDSTGRRSSTGTGTRKAVEN